MRVRATHLAARVDELTHIVAPVVPQIVQIGVFDGRIVHVDVVVFHKSHRNGRLACAGGSGQACRKRRLALGAAPTARKPIIANRRFSVVEEAAVLVEEEALIDVLKEREFVVDRSRKCFQSI